MKQTRTSSMCVCQCGRLVVEIAPQITFPEDHDREANPGIIIKLEADFGYTSDRKVFDRVFDF